MKIKILLLTFGLIKAQGPDLQNTYGIGRAHLTPEDALGQHVPSLTQNQIDQLISGSFDIFENFNLAMNNAGFFITDDKAKFQNVYFRYQEPDEFYGANKMGIIEYDGCGQDPNGERFNITDGYVTSDGNWQFNKNYIGTGPYGWKHGWRYFGNVVGQVLNGGIQYQNASELEKPLTQAFFFPVDEDHSSICEKSSSDNLFTDSLDDSMPPMTTVSAPYVPHPSNENLASRCSSQLIRLKGIYGSEMAEEKQQRQLANRMSLLDSVLMNVLNGEHKSRGKKELIEIESVPRIGKNADLRSVYIRCFKNFIPKIFANFKHGGRHLVKRSANIFKKVCEITNHKNDLKFCSRLK